MSLTKNPGRREHSEFSFESYVERQFVLLHEGQALIIERLNQMGFNIAGLEVDEEVLSQVVPFLVNEVTTLSSEKQTEEAALQTKVTELQAKEGEVAADATALAAVKGELATAQGELSQVEAVVKRLEPAVQEAEKVLPEPTPTSTEPTQPVYTYTPGEGISPDTRFSESGFQEPGVEGGASTPLLYFSGDTPNQTLTAIGGTVPGYTQYTGATEPVPAA